MTNYTFTIVLERPKAEIHDIEDKLFEAGCDDALLCFCNDTPYLEFDREAASAKEAINSAISDIKKAGFSIVSINEAGYASMADMASISKVTRASINNYIKGRRGDKLFPQPKFGVLGGVPLYSWPEAAQWLYRHNAVKKATLDIAMAAQEISSQLQENETYAQEQLAS